MRLTELDPHWVAASYRDAAGLQWSGIEPTGESRRGMGLSFLCPVHRDHRLAVCFTNPVDDGPAAEGYKHLWQRSGQTFDDLTLGPSIDASGNMHGDAIQTPCWHGFITSGEIW